MRRAQAQPGERVAGAPSDRPQRSSRTVIDQRSRLLASILTVVSRCGYAGAKVGDIAARANVSRSTFYELFDDKQQCFIAAHSQLAGRVIKRFEDALARAEASEATGAALTLIASLAEQQPAVLTLLTHEALLAGPPARQRYEQLMARLGDAVQARMWRAAAGSELPVVPSPMLLGGAARLYCMQIRREGGASAQTLPALLRWVDSYRGAPDAYPWLSAQQPGALRAIAPARPFSPRVLPRGRHRLPRDTVDAIQRERIAHATALAVMRRDGTDVAVADIVAAAGVSREVFYAHFADKQDAFLATQRLIFEQLIAVASSAYFVPDRSWPERLWDAAASSAGMLAANPAFAHFAFVAAYGIGEIGVRRVDEALLAFGLFLEDGYRLPPGASSPPRVTSEAIALGAMEAAARQVRDGRTFELPALVPVVVFTSLAPFIGCGAAGVAVEQQLAA